MLSETTIALARSQSRINYKNSASCRVTASDAKRQPNATATPNSLGQTENRQSSLFVQQFQPLERFTLANAPQRDKLRKLLLPRTALAVLPVVNSQRRNTHELGVVGR